MPLSTRPVSVRVPKDLPDKIRALTGLPFSKAVVTMMEAFVRANEHKLASSTSPGEPTE